MPDLTLAELLTHLKRIGADPETVTFETPLGPVEDLDDAWFLNRSNGGIVVSLGSMEDLG